MFRLLKITPPHGWNAVGWELAIVTLGVVIALGAQQVVEDLHWRSETAKLRESLHREIKDDQWNAANRIMISACIRQRIARLEGQLSQPGTSWRGDPIPGGADQRWSALPIAFKFPSIESFYTSGHWQTALASGELAHMPEAERNGYSYTYRAIEDLRALSTEEGSIAAHLQPLARDRQLDNEQRLQFQAELASLDRLNGVLTIYSRKFLEGTRRAGIIPRTEDIDSAYRLARTDYGDCARPLSSTVDALRAGNNASEAMPQTD